MPVKFDTTIGQLSHLNTSYLHIPAEVVDGMGGFNKTRLICTVNGKVSFQCGFMSLGKGEAYISINKKRMQEAGVEPGAVVNVELVPDKSQYGMDVPEELAEVFRQDPEGEARFKMLTPGKRRYIIFYVSSVKSSQLSIDRALLLIGNLKTLPKGKESFRGMLGIGN
jgi:hypothetical protein